MLISKSFSDSRKNYDHIFSGLYSREVWSDPKPMRPLAFFSPNDCWKTRMWLILMTQDSIRDLQWGRTGSMSKLVPSSQAIHRFQGRSLGNDSKGWDRFCYSTSYFRVSTQTRGWFLRANLAACLRYENTVNVLRDAMQFVKATTVGTSASEKKTLRRSKTRNDIKEVEFLLLVKEV